MKSVCELFRKCSFKSGKLSKNVQSVLPLSGIRGLTLSHDDVTKLTSTEDKDGIRIITLNNPKKRNALSSQMMKNLLEDLRGCDRGVKVVILKSVGKVFSAGHDLTELQSEYGLEHHREVFSLCTEMMTLIPKLPVPVIAQVSGLATAAGCQLVASCDVAVAAASTKFALPGILVGLFCSTPAIAVARSLPRKVVMEMLFTGQPISAEVAYQHGLLSRIVDDSELDIQTLTLARRICEMSRDVISIGKECFYKQIELNIDDAYSIAEKTMMKNLQMSDCHEGIKAFVEKRKPKWTT